MTALSDEPTAGPTPADVAVRLLRAIDRAPSVVVSLIDPDLRTRWISASADWVIDIGPEGGDGGGRIVATGTPEDVSKNPESHTGHYLKPLLEARKVAAE